MSSSRICVPCRSAGHGARFEVASLLDDGMIYNEILERTGASSATISRVNRSLSYGTGAYEKIFARYKKRDK